MKNNPFQSRHGDLPTCTIFYKKIPGCCIAENRTVLKKFNIFLAKIEASPLSLIDINKFLDKYGRASE
jgi:hypothetical protein